MGTAVAFAVLAVAFAVPTAVLAGAAAVLVRRDRRRSQGGAHSAAIEAKATRGLREACRKAHATDHFAGGAALGALRDRHDHGRYRPARTAPPPTRRQRDTHTT